MRKSDSFAEILFISSDSKKYISATKFACGGLTAMKNDECRFTI